MKLHQFFKLLKYSGEIKLVMNSHQIEFLYKEKGLTMITTSYKTSVNKELTKQVGFEVYHWLEISDIIQTTQAWHIYENLKNQSSVIIKEQTKERWLENDEK